VNLLRPFQWLLWTLLWTPLWTVLCGLTGTAQGATMAWPAVVPGVPLVFPRDHGAHPDFRNEWWYLTGWLKTADGRDLGFQITFFRNRPDSNPANPSRFAPRQLIFAHAALADAGRGRFQHDQRIARQGFGVANAATADTDVTVERWRLQRNTSTGVYTTRVAAREFTLELELQPSLAPWAQGEGGISRKGPLATQASYYYSQPQLKVRGSVLQNGQNQTVSGSAWLDHEWSSTLLDARAAGWDWAGVNLADGGALMAFQIRQRDGSVLWAGGSHLGANGSVTRLAPDAVRFTAQRRWRSPLTGALYPVEQQLTAGQHSCHLQPMLDNQELDSRASSGVVYWEGAVRCLDPAGREKGRGYLELTGYFRALKL